MEKRRISLADIVLGTPLLWDVSDSAGHLLLKHGQIIQTARQIEVLVERGLFIDAGHFVAAKEAIPAAKLAEPPSVLRLINQAEKRLERLLFNLNNETELESKLVELAKILQFALSSNREIALATVLLNQACGPYPVRHGIDTAIVAMAMARSLRKSVEDITAVAVAAMLMNLGMLRQQDHLETKTEPLTETEQQQIHHHPEESVRLLREVGITHPLWLEIVLLHHENLDGTGYPFGKSADAIPENVQITALADRYCARVSNRLCRSPMLPNAALRELLTHDKATVDQRLAATLIHELGIYPIGMFVRLQNGEIAVISGKGESTTAPTAHALIGPRGAPLAFPIKRDTSKALLSVREAVPAEAAFMRFSMQQVWGSEAKL